MPVAYIMDGFYFTKRTSAKSKSFGRLQMDVVVCSLSLNLKPCDMKWIGFCVFIASHSEIWDLKHLLQSQMFHFSFIDGIRRNAYIATAKNTDEK